MTYNERAEVALLEQAATRPLDPGEVPQMLFTVKEESIKGHPELEAMVKAVEQATTAPGSQGAGRWSAFVEARRQTVPAWWGGRGGMGGG